MSQENYYYVEITVFDHQQNKKQAVLMYFIPIVFGFECILEMSYFIARADVWEVYAIWDLRYHENKMCLCFLLQNMKSNTYFCRLS